MLKALELFYSTGVSVTSQDYYGGNTESPVVVELTWDCLTAQETSEFGSYVRDRTLTVRKVMEWREGGKPTERYHG